MTTGTISPPYGGGKYYLQSAQKNVYTAYCAAQATSLVGTGMVGLQVWNPPFTPSPTNPVGAKALVLIDVGGMIIVTSAATTSLVLAFGTGQLTAPTGQTPATQVTNGFLGTAAPAAGIQPALGQQASPTGLALAAGTFTNAPVAFKNLMHNTAAIATTGEDQGFQLDLNGKWVVPPGSYVAIAAVGAAVAASGSNLDLTWIEVPWP